MGVAHTRRTHAPWNSNAQSGAWSQEVFGRHIVISLDDCLPAASYPTLRPLSVSISNFSFLSSCHYRCTSHAVPFRRQNRNTHSSRSLYEENEPPRSLCYICCSSKESFQPNHQSTRLETTPRSKERARPLRRVTISHLCTLTSTLR